MAFKLKLFKKKGPQDLLGFDLNEERLKIVHVRLSGLKREVVNLSVSEVHGMSDDDIAALIAKKVAELKLTDPRAYICVPLNALITRIIEIPSRDQEEIKEIVSLQASRHTPYSRSEIIIDMLALGVVRESYTKVLLVIAPRDIVVRQTKILQRARLEPAKVFFSSEGICHACAKILGAETGDQTVAVVHMDDSFTSFNVIRKGRIHFMRGIPIGASHLFAEKEIYGDQFMDELQKSLDAYIHDEGGLLPSQLVLTGVVGEVSELDELFRHTLNMPIKHTMYFNYFPISEKAKAVASSSTKVSFFNVIAPLLLFDRMKIDLTSDEQKFKMQLEVRGKEMMKLGVLVIIFLAAIFLFFATKIYLKNLYLNNLTARYKTVMEDAKELERNFEKIQLIKKNLAERGYSLQALSALYDVVPNDVKLSDLRYDERKFTFKGTSAAMKSVFSFVTSLEKSKLFKEVKTKYVTMRSEDGRDVVDFEIATQVGE